MALGASVIAVSVFVILEAIIPVGNIPRVVVVALVAPFLVLQIVGAYHAFRYQPNVQGVASSIITGAFLFVVGGLLSCFFQTVLDLYLDVLLRSPP